MSRPGTRLSPVRPAWALVRESASKLAPALILLSLFESVVPIFIALLTKSIINSLTSSPASTVVTLALMLSGLVVIQLIVPLGTRLAGQAVSRAAQLAVRERLFQAVNSYDGLAQFDDPEFHDHLKLAEQAGDMAPTRLVNGGLNLLQGTVTAAGFVITLFLLNPLLALLALGSGVPVAFVEFFVARRQVTLTRALSPEHRLAMVFSTLQTDERAVKEIRLFGLRQFLQNKLTIVLRRANDAERLHDISIASKQVLAAAGSGVIAGSAVVLAVAMARQGELTAGDIAVVLAALGSVQITLSGAFREVAQVRASLALLGHYQTVVALAGREERQDRRRIRTPPLLGKIEFTDVSFRYDDEHPWVLRHLTFNIDAFSAVALVGLNGAGKSTVVKLLCRLYSPSEGSITWDGIDLEAMSVESLRERISAVFQDFMSYELTAEENIAVGNLSAESDRPRLVNAAELSGIHAALEKLPRGYSTLLSKVFFDGVGETEAGVTLSGGQWQRVAVARALFRSPCDLMILDEPSSGLDADAEHEIHMNLRRLRASGTSVLISHRLSTVRDATKILVLSEGRVSEQGTHSQLMLLGGTYSRLFNRQASGYLDEGSRVESDQSAQYLGVVANDC